MGLGESVQDPSGDYRVNIAAIGQIMDVAGQINAACDAKGLERDSAARQRMHGYHGEIIARGGNAEEVMRVVNAALEHVQ